MYEHYWSGEWAIAREKKIINAQGCTISCKLSWNSKRKVMPARPGECTCDVNTPWKNRGTSDLSMPRDTESLAIDLIAHEWYAMDHRTTFKEECRTGLTKFNYQVVMPCSRSAFPDLTRWWPVQMCTIDRKDKASDQALWIRQSQDRLGGRLDHNLTGQLTTQHITACSE